MERVSRKILLMMAGLAVIAFVCFMTYHVVFATTNTNLYPGDLPLWYAYPAKGVAEDTLGHLGREQYVLTSRTTDNPPGFPTLSPYPAQATYLRRNSTDTYSIAVWYFDDRETFAVAESRLLDNLEHTGNARRVTLNLSQQEEDYREAMTLDPMVVSPEFPRFLNVTAFESANRSGYFIAVKKPIIWGREDYFLLGYLAGTGNLSTQSPYLQDLVARGYYNVTGSYEELKNEQ